MYDGLDVSTVRNFGTALLIGALLSLLVVGAGWLWSLKNNVF